MLKKFALFSKPGYRCSVENVYLNDVDAKEFYQLITSSKIKKFSVPPVYLQSDLASLHSVVVKDISRNILKNLVFKRGVYEKNRQL